MIELPGDTGGPLVWTGRPRDGVPPGLDGWNTSDDALVARLEAASGLVVLDPLSFPWRALSGSGRNVPLAVTLPEDVATDDLVALLGRPLLQHVTPWDRLVEPRADVRADLGARFRLPPETWADGIDEATEQLAAGPSALAAKTTFRQVVQLVADDVRRSLGDAGEGLVGVLGRSASLAGHLTRRAGTPVRDYTAAADGGTVPAPESPHVVVVWLDDGGQAVEERRALLDHALSLLHPGGRLVLVGYVVTEPGGRENPAISRLVEEVQAVSGGLVHVDELRSVRWAAEPLTRGVLVGLTSLRTGRI